MKPIKYILLTALVIFGWGVIDAQQGRSNRQCTRSVASMEASYDELGLTADQKALLIAENDRFEKERRDFRSQNKGQSGNYDQLESLREQHSANIQGIMDEDQYSKYREKRKETRKSCRQGHRHGQGPGRR